MTIYRFSSIVKPIFLTRSPKTGDMKRIDQRDTSMVIQPHLPAGQTQDSVWVYLRRVEVVLAVMLLCELNTGGKISGICEIAPFKCQTQYCWMLHSFSWVISWVSILHAVNLGFMILVVHTLLTYNEPEFSSHFRGKQKTL